MAIASEIFLGLEPCQLCIYQRWGFVGAGVFALLGLIAHKKKKAVITFSMLSGLSFLTNAAIAFYHTGVEQKWWASAFEACAVPASFSGNDQNWLDNIMSAPSAPCDVIPWQDPLIGLSMANYNVILCVAMFVVCLVMAITTKKNFAS